MRDADVQISHSEKKALIDDILSSKAFSVAGKAVRGQRAREILSYLFRRHCDNPNDHVSEKELWISIFGLEHVADETRARTAVVRLRKLLGRYFLGRGAHRSVRVAVPPGAYALEFSRVESRSDIFDWFWGPFIVETSRLAFGIVPQMYPRGDTRGYIQAYASFARMMADHAVDLDVLPNELPADFFSTAGSYYARLMAIFVGGEETLQGDDRYSLPGSDRLRFLASYGAVDYRMFRDPAGNTAICRRTEPPPGRPRTIVDDVTTKHVLFTRVVAAKHRSVVSLVMARHLDSCIAVSDFLTSGEGLQILAKYPSLASLWAAPLELQIIFSTSSTHSDDVCFSSVATEQFNHIGIVDCSYTSDAFDEDEGGDD